MSLLRKSKRRPAPLTDADYDHEIRLEDHTKTQSPQGHSRSHSDGLQPSSTHVSDSSSRRHSDVPLYKHTTPLHIREELLRRKFSKYQDRHEGSYDGPQGAAGSEDGDGAQNDEAQAGETEEGRPRTSQSIPKPKPSDADSAIDILFENQRGGFICGIPLFSSKALGGLDHAPWTNSVHKPSATDITNAQVPDPSWEWAWKDWHINKEDGSHVDEDGWEYSFAFGKKISWHGPQWWNSYVRRRAWTRKRVKKHSGYQSNQPHMLAPEYFTIHAVEERVPSRVTSMEASTMNRPSFGSLARRDIDGDIVIEEIKDIASLMRILRVARIDREKTEAVEHFTEHGGDDLYYLQEYMHEIMRMFIFQASRRLLLTHLLKIFNEASEQQKKSSEEEVDPAKKRRLEYLEAAVKHADEEVKKLEFWSDVKNMAQKGQTLGAADASKGWDESWAGLDNSGPKDVISDKKVPGLDGCEPSEGNGTATKGDKGKGKAQD